MNAITNFIGIVFAIGAAFVLTCIIASFLFAMKWMEGIITLFEQLGLSDFVRTLPLNNPDAANWIMWGVALFASLAAIGLTVKVVEALQNSLMNVVGCLIMFMIVVIPVYHQLYMDKHGTPIVQQFIEEAQETVSNIEAPEVKISIDL